MSSSTTTYDTRFLNRKHNPITLAITTTETSHPEVREMVKVTSFDEETQKEHWEMVNRLVRPAGITTSTIVRSRNRYGVVKLYGGVL